MDEISFTAAAKADLAAIDEYSAIEFGHDVADEYSRGFTKAFNLLRDHPHVGAAYPELGKGIRCLTHHRHRIFYIVQHDLVLILRIVHYARDARMVLRKEGR